MRTTVLMFKVAATKGMLMANAVLKLFCEFKQGFGLHRWLEQETPLSGNRRDYAVLGYVKSCRHDPDFRPQAHLTVKIPSFVQAHLSLGRKAPPCV